MHRPLDGPGVTLYLGSRFSKIIRHQTKTGPDPQHCLPGYNWLQPLGPGGIFKYLTPMRDLTFPLDTTIEGMCARAVKSLSRRKK